MECGESPKTLIQILSEAIYKDVAGNYFLNLSTVEVDCDAISPLIECATLFEESDISKIEDSDSCGKKTLRVGFDPSLFLPHTFGAYGSMYMEDTSVNTTIATAHLYYPILSGFTTGLVSGITFENARELKIITAGIYKVDWSMSISCNSSDQTIEGLIMSGALGLTANVNTVNTTRAKENGVVYSVSGGGIISCVAGDLIRLGLENETSNGKIITCNHANLTVVQINN